MSDLTYDGYDDPLTKVIEEGTLFKKESGMFSSIWKPYKVALTGAGFFHMINLSDGAKSGDIVLPELSLDLSECTVGPLMLNDKEPEEFILSEKSTGIFGREVKHKVFFIETKLKMEPGYFFYKDNFLFKNRSREKTWKLAQNGGGFCRITSGP